MVRMESLFHLCVSEREHLLEDPIKMEILLLCLMVFVYMCPCVCVRLGGCLAEISCWMSLMNMNNLCDTSSLSVNYYHMKIFVAISILLSHMSAIEIM